MTSLIPTSQLADTSSRSSLSEKSQQDSAQHDLEHKDQIKERQACQWTQTTKGDAAADASHGTVEAQPTAEVVPSAIPNGGLQAWLQVFSGFMLFLNSWGMTTSFGVFQQYYSATYIPTVSNSTISWIGTLSSFMLSLSATFAGPILDRGHPRYIVLCGGFLVTLGLMMTSLCREYWQLVLAQGLCIGIGSGQLFIVAVAVLPGWFSTRRAGATGLASTGSSVGGIIYPIVFHRLVGQIGFGWTTRVMGFIALATCLVALSLTKMRTLPPIRRKLIDFSGFRELPFVLFSLVSFFGGIGLYVPFFYITEYSLAKVDNISPELAFYMLPILGVGSIFGRIFPAFAADKLGSLNVLAFCTAAAALLAFCWIAVTSVAGIIVWALLYGFFSGTWVSLQVPIMATITKDPRILGGRVGINNLCGSIGILIGNPIAGALAKSDWAGLQVFCGATLVASATLAVISKIWVFGPALSNRA